MPISCHWLKSQTMQKDNPTYPLDRNSSVSWIPPVGFSLFSFWKFRGLICMAPNLTVVSISSKWSVNLIIHIFWVQIFFMRILKKIKCCVFKDYAPAVFATCYHPANATAATQWYCHLLSILTSEILKHFCNAFLKTCKTSEL